MRPGNRAGIRANGGRRGESSLPALFTNQEAEKYAAGYALQFYTSRRTSGEEMYSMSVMDEYMRLREKLQADVETVLLTRVAPAVKEEMQTQVYDKVYGTYTPRVYKRRYQDGGLGDMRNYDAAVDSGTMTLTVQNLTRDDGYWRPVGAPDRFLTPVVESGDGYDYASPGPRPFNKATEREVIRDGTVERELRQGLTALGHEMEGT